MLESFRSGSFTYNKLTEEELNKRGILGRLVGIIADTKNPTRNDRKYGPKLWQKVFDSDIMKEKIANHAAFGQLGHPSYEEVDPEKIAICLAEQPKMGQDGKLYGVFDILATPCGKILKLLCDYGCNIGISSRGTGDLYTDDDGNEAVDPESYLCECFDAVLIPAVKEARLQYVTESLNNKKSLKVALQESLNSASEEDRKVMEEAIDDLDLNTSYEEGESKYDMEQEIKKELSDVGIDEDAEGPFRDDPDIVVESLSEAELPKFENGQKVTYQGRQGTVNTQDGDEVIVEFGETEDKPAEELSIPVSELSSVSYNESLGQEVEYSIEPLDDGQFQVQCEGDEIYTFDTEEDAQNFIDGIKAISDESLEDREAEDVVDDESNELVAELQEALKEVQNLKAENKSLQEKLSISHTKETELTEQVAKYKSATANLSEQAKSAKALKESLTKNDKLLSASKEELKANQVELDSLRESKLSTEVQLKKLNESLDKISKQLEESQQLVGKYRKSYKALKESYLNVKVQSLGLKKSDVLHNLNESYKIKDIDSTCLKLYEQKQKINKLPFVVNGNTKVTFKESNEYIGGLKTELSDDYVSPTLMQLLN